jgi:outer membrane protein assembly factor BamD (BamD/ComL family)
MAESLTTIKLDIAIAISAICIFGGCGGVEGSSITGPPDNVLYERGMFALEQDKVDVACLTLTTLINTYPESQYASSAKHVVDYQGCTDTSNYNEFVVWSSQVPR